VLIARREGYDRPDHPFMATSLKVLAPGDATNALLERLWSGPLKARQLVTPEPVWEVTRPSRKSEAAQPPEDAEKPTAAKLNTVRLYFPTPQIEQRLGKDPKISGH